MARKKITPSGKAIRKLMINAELTAADLADVLAISADYIRQICRDERKATKMRKIIHNYLKEVA